MVHYGKQYYTHYTVLPGEGEKKSKYENLWIKRPEQPSRTTPVHLNW